MSRYYAQLDDFEAWELEAFADGIAMPHIAAFFETNPDVRAAWQQDEARFVQLADTLYRFDCPTPEQLRAYHWHELTENEAVTLSRHFQVCSDCAEELAMVQRLLPANVDPVVAPAATPDREPTPLETFTVDTMRNKWPALWEAAQELLDNLQVTVATLLSPSSPATAGMALRRDGGFEAQSATPEMYLLKAAEFDITLFMRKEPNNTYTMEGQLLGPENTSSGQFLLTPATATSPVQQGNIDENGEFVITALRPDQYQLVLRVADQTLVVPDLALV